MDGLILRVFGPLAAASMAFLAEAQSYRDGFEIWQGAWGWSAMILSGLIMILFWAVVISLIVLLVRWMTGSGAAPEVKPARSSAVDILEERYARGEINREEFEERRRVLLGLADLRPG